MHQNRRISMLKSENFLVRISKFPLRCYKTRQDTELPLKSQIFRSRLENTSKQRNRVQTQHRNAHPRLSKNSKTSSASLLKARNPSYFSVRKLQNTPRRCENSKTQPTPPRWGSALCACSWILSVFHHFWVLLSNFVCFSSFFNFSDIFSVILTRIFHVFVLFLLIFATFWTVFSHSRDSWENVTKQCKNSTKLEKICPKHEKYESETHWKYKKNRKNEEKHTRFERNTQKW